MAQVLRPLHPRGRPKLLAAGFRWPSSAIVTIWGVNQRTEDPMFVCVLSLSLSPLPLPPPLHKSAFQIKLNLEKKMKCLGSMGRKETYSGVRFLGILRVLDLF